MVIARSLRLCIRPPGADHLESLEIMADKTVKELKHVVCVWKMIAQIGARTLVVTAARVGLVFWRPVINPLASVFVYRSTLCTVVRILANLSSC